MSLLTEDQQKAVNYLGLDTLINIILVNEGVRHAMLIQPADFMERTHEDEMTKRALEYIKFLFPKLIHSNNYETYQGVIVSKKKYNHKHDITLEKMGEILGYPCYKDFMNLDRTKDTYRLSLVVETNDENTYDLFTNICSEVSKKPEFDEYTNKVLNALKKPEYSKFFTGSNEIKNVKVTVDKIVSPESIVEKLIHGNELDNADKSEILTILYNIGFDIDTQLFFMEPEFNNYNNFQYDNPIHKGILIGILLDVINNRLMPFYPLQKYPKQDKQIQEITEKLQKDLLNVLKKTSNKVKMEGGRGRGRFSKKNKKRGKYKTSKRG
jgi:hypothetical protein